MSGISATVDQVELHFGLAVPASAAPGADPVEDARSAERLGYDFLTMADHPCGTSPSYETWTMLTWIAAATSTIRIAPRVLGVPYRNPAMVAKMAETLHRLCGGRLVLGLGGGYSDEEFRAFGLTVPSPREKVDGMADAIAIARGLWTESAFSHPGRIHHTDAATIAPKPERPIPIWLGTFGPRALRVTGALADGWIPSLGYAADADLPRMRARVLTAAEAAGRDPAALTCALHLQIALGDPGAGDRTEPDSGVLSGSADAVASRLVDLVGRGFTAFSIAPTGEPDRAAQAERIALDVLPAVRAGV